VDEIAAFTELGDYLHMPVRTYSTGMYLRLAFAVSTSVTPEILLMDEFLGAGDAHFLAKAEKRLNQIVDRAGILVLASHSMQLIKRLCNKVVWMSTGEIKAQGEPDAILAEYFGRQPDAHAEHYVAG